MQVTTFIGGRHPLNINAQVAQLPGMAVVPSDAEPFAVPPDRRHRSVHAVVVRGRFAASDDAVTLRRE